MKPENVTINARKYDGKVHRSWQADLIAQEQTMMLFVGTFATDVMHPDLGLIEKGSVSYEYYWTDRWYNVFRFHTPAGTFRNFYCNINMPPTFGDGVLDYIDLDIDLLVHEDWTVELLDAEEFERNSALYGYGEDLKRTALAQVDRIQELIRTRRFPFTNTDSLSA